MVEGPLRLLPWRAFRWPWPKSCDGSGSGLAGGAAIGGVIALVVLLIVTIGGLGGLPSGLAVSIAVSLDLDRRSGRSGDHCHSRWHVHRQGFRVTPLGSITCC